MRLALILMLVMVLTACAGKRTFYKAGASQQDWVKDHYECERDARQSGYFGGGIVGAINAQEFQVRCLNARGWYEAQQ